MTKITLGEKAVAVTWDPEDGWNIYMPKEDEILESTGAALVAAALRISSSEDFITEQLEWMKEQG